MTKISINEIARLLSNNKDEQIITLHGEAYFEAINQKAIEAKKEIEKQRKEIQRENSKV